MRSVWLKTVLLAVLLCSGCVIPPKRFSVRQVSPGIFIGTQPTSAKDFAVLQTNGIRTVISLQCLPWNVRRSERLAHESGMQFQHIPVPAWPLEPSERRVKQAVLALADKSRQPIFVHCYLGHDRAALIVGLYRIYYENWHPDDAWAEALHNGFKLRWALSGLRNYFWDHCQRPDWVTVRAVARKKEQTDPTGGTSQGPPPDVGGRGISQVPLGRSFGGPRQSQPQHGQN